MKDYKDEIVEALRSGKKKHEEKVKLEKNQNHLKRLNEELALKKASVVVDNTFGFFNILFATNELIDQILKYTKAIDFLRPEKVSTVYLPKEYRGSILPELYYDEEHVFGYSWKIITYETVAEIFLTGEQGALGKKVPQIFFISYNPTNVTRINMENAEKDLMSAMLEFLEATVASRGLVN